MTMNEEKEQEAATSTGQEASPVEKKKLGKYVTQEQFTEVMGYLERLAADSNQRKAELGTITNLSTNQENQNARVGALEANQEKMINILQQQQQQQPQPAAAQGRQPFDIAGSAEALKVIAQAGREIKDAYEGNQSGTLDKLATLVRNRYERKVAIAAEKDIKKWLKAGDIDADEVVGLIDTTRTGGSNHEPVL